MKSIYIVVRTSGTYLRPLGAYFNWRTAEKLIRKMNARGGPEYYRIKIAIKDEQRD